MNPGLATLSNSELGHVAYEDGCSHAEIAAFLGVTTNAVKTRLYAARQR